MSMRPNIEESELACLDLTDPVIRNRVQPRVISAAFR